MQLRSQLTLSTHFSDLSLNAQHISGRRWYALGTNWQPKDQHRDIMFSLVLVAGELERHGRTPCLRILAVITRPRAHVGSVLPNKVIDCRVTIMLKAPQAMGVRVDGLEDRQARFNLERKRTELFVTTSKVVCAVYYNHFDTGFLGAGRRISRHDILLVSVPSIAFIAFFGLPNVSNWVKLRVVYYRFEKMIDATTSVAFIFT
jgi:hypothetical protein